MSIMAVHDGAILMSPQNGEGRLGQIWWGCAHRPEKNLASLFLISTPSNALRIITAAIGKTIQRRKTPSYSWTKRRAS